MINHAFTHNGQIIELTGTQESVRAQVIALGLADPFPRVLTEEELAQDAD